MHSLNKNDEGCKGEARRFERYPVQVPARVEVLRSRRNEENQYLRTYNLSASGAFFPDWQSVPIGELLQVEFYLFFASQDTGQTSYDMVVTTVTGRVVRSDSCGTAVSFAEDYQMNAYQCLVSVPGEQETFNLPAGLRGLLANMGTRNIPGMSIACH